MTNKVLVDFFIDKAHSTFFDYLRQTIVLEDDNLMEFIEDDPDIKHIAKEHSEECFVSKEIDLEKIYSSVYENIYSALLAFKPKVLCCGDLQVAQVEFLEGLEITMFLGRKGKHYV